MKNEPFIINIIVTGPTGCGKSRVLNIINHTLGKEFDLIYSGINEPAAAPMQETYWARVRMRAMEGTK